MLERALGPDHPEVATALNNLAGLDARLGRYTEAEPLYKRAIAIDEKALGPGHPTVAQLRGNLATMYDAQGRHAEAEALRHGQGGAAGRSAGGAVLPGPLGFPDPRPRQPTRKVGFRHLQLPSSFHVKSMPC
jgi:hypothetical protein